MYSLNFTGFHKRQKIYAEWPGPPYLPFTHRRGNDLSVWGAKLAKNNQDNQI